jgi:ATP-dependent Clp protease ATP-binding subunit ClpC
MTSRPADIQEAEAELKQLKREQDYAKSRKLFDKSKELEGKIKEEEEQLEELIEKWKGRVATGSQEVRVEHVADIVSRLTGIPVSELTVEERERLLEMEKRLHERVIGQDQAIEAVSNAVRLARAGLREGRRPISTFMFLGPTGVGKTELAKTLAEIVFGDEDAIVRIDMSEYTERHTVARLIGAPPGYVGYEEGGQLTERVRRRPHSVILLDEIEKAHPEVNNVLLQVFDDGRLTDGKGRVVDFTNTIIIATSNVGADLIRENLHQGKDYEQLKTEVMSLLNRHFRPEFLNRIDEIIVFHSLSREQITEIVRLQLEHLSRTARAQRIQLTFDDSAIEHMAEVGFMPEYGARELKRKIRSEIETKLATALLRKEITEGAEILVRYDPDSDSIKLDNAKEHATTGV